MEGLGRIVVAVDPPTTSKAGSDECGIVVVGADTRGEPRGWRAVVLEDATVRGASPDGWARAVVAAAARHKADRVVADVNQGGDMVAEVLRQVDATLPVRKVNATRGKHIRAEPVAALYEQGRVRHVRGLGLLEEQMMKMTVTGWQGAKSPDRLDAQVWALTDLIIEPAAAHRDPKLRFL